ncbi:MAG: hypothetical protein HQL69_23055 [Magnetococcales bacterium]|nr:hypothetical protein [Magnetococcales bacterium]
MNDHPVAVILNVEQRGALQALAARYRTEIDWDSILVGGVSGLPSDWILCQVGPITVGVDPEGHIHS